MSKPIAVFTADTHLADRAWAGREISGDAYYSFSQIINYAVSLELPVFAAGDLLDRSLNYASPVAAAFAKLDRLHRVNQPFHFIQGQHDMSKPPWFSAHPAANHLSGQTVRVGNIDVFGLDFHPAELLQIALGAIPAGSDILMAHQVWSLFMGDIASPQGGPQDVPVVSVVFTGDYHVTKETNTTGRAGQKLKFISPGSTHMLSIDEDPKKRFYVLYDDFSWKRIRLKTRERIDHAFDGVTDIDTMLQGLEVELQRVMDETAGHDERVRKPIFWIEYPHHLSGHRSRIERAINGRGFIFWKERPPEPPPEVVLRRKTAVESGERRAATLLSELPGYLAQTKQLHLKGDCTRLLQAEDVASELRRMREEALK